MYINKSFSKNVKLRCKLLKMVRRRQRGRGKKWQWFKGIVKKHGKKYGKMALSHGKRLAIAKAKEYAPILAQKGLEKGMAKLSQMGSGQRRRRYRRQRGKGAVGDFLANLAKKGVGMAIDKASKFVPI